LDKAIQDVRLIAYGQYSGDDSCNRNGKVCINNPQPQQAKFNPPSGLKSQSETCIIVISDTEVVDDDDVFSS